MMEYRPDFDKKDHVRNPSFSRNRIAYRSPVLSKDVNLEDHQISYEMAKLTAQIENLRSGFKANATEFEGLLDSNNYLLGKIHNLSQRLKTLEGS